MPIYEYRCEACGHELEAIQKISAAPLTDCPGCGTAALKKKISAVGFRLKGSGWYETDFKTGDKKKNLSKGEDTQGAKSDSKSATKADPKSDSKTSNSPSDTKSASKAATG